MYDICIVNTHEMQVWTICTPETAAQELENAERYASENIARMEDLNQRYPDNPMFGHMLDNARNARYSLMTFDEFLSLKWCTIDGIEMFCMSEMYTGSYTTQYAHDRKTGKYWSKMVDALDPDTWIHKAITYSDVNRAEMDIKCKV